MTSGCYFFFSKILTFLDQKLGQSARMAKNAFVADLLYLEKIGLHHGFDFMENDIK